MNTTTHLILILLVVLTVCHIAVIVGVPEPEEVAALVKGLLK
jgi:hypothetical protein